MTVTVSSMLIALIASTLLIALLSYIFATKRSYKNFRIDFLSILFLITVFRLCFPSEAFYTFTIEAPLFMNPITEFLNIKIINNLSILHLLIIIWIVGCLYKGKKLFDQINQTNYLFCCIKRKSKRKEIKYYLPEYQGKDYPIYFSEFVPSPMVLLFKKAILLPYVDYTDLEITNILNHEIAHLSYHDAFIKRFIQILTILYWWFPLVYVLEKQINLYLELRVDSRVSRKMNKEDSLHYMSTLLSVKRKSLDSSLFPITQISSFTIMENKDILTFRIEYFLEGNFKNKTKKPILVCLIFLFICSNLIIFEPSYPNTEITEGTHSTTEFGYIVHKKDGSYCLILKDGINAGTFSDISDPIFKGLEIREE
ncbi:M56 family metallopeptidase [Erysipelotrichaceae bacterium HCN-30851]